MSASSLSLIETSHDCPCTGGTLDRLIQPALLTILARGPLHGYELAKQIGAMPSFSGQTPDRSGVYRFLKAMDDKRVVESTWDVAAAGPARHLYRITPSGRCCLTRWIKTLEEYRTAIGQMVAEARKATGQ